MSHEIAMAYADLETMSLLQLELADSRARERAAADAYHDLEALYSAVIERAQRAEARNLGLINSIAVAISELDDIGDIELDHITEHLEVAIEQQAHGMRLLKLFKAAQTVATEAGRAIGRGFIHQELRIAVEDYQQLAKECDP